MLTSRSKTVRLVKQFVFPGAMTRIRWKLAGDTNPLTGLPGNIALEQELHKRTAEKLPICAVYVSLPHKLYKQKYGLSGGNRIILFTSKLLANILKKYGGDKDFLAHIEGNNFIAIMEKERVDAFCERTIKYFDSLIMSLVEQEERKKGRRLTYNKEGFPFLSMFVLDFEKDDKINLKAISQKMEQLRYYAKSNRDIL